MFTVPEILNQDRTTGCDVACAYFQSDEAPAAL